jgi:hypothetical protein
MSRIFVKEFFLPHPQFSMVFPFFENGRCSVHESPQTLSFEVIFPIIRPHPCPSPKIVQGRTGYNRTLRI